MAENMQCIICGGDGKLAILGKKGMKTITSISVARGDGLVNNLIPHKSYGVHVKCRKKYSKTITLSATTSSVNAVNIIGETSDALPCEPLLNSKIVNDSKTFSWDCDCFICGKQLKLKGKRSCLKKVFYVSKRSMADNILSACASRSDQLSLDMCYRIKSVSDLVSVGARYHVACKLFIYSQRKVFLQESNDFMNATHESAQISHQVTTLCQPSVTCIELPVLIVDSCGAATSHQDYLVNFASVNNLKLVDTIGGGNCFFDAVRQCIAQFGLIRTVRELRLAAALELNLNSNEYSYVYLTEHEVGQHHQSATYDEFVRRTRDELEWATQVTVASMAKSLNVVIRLVSTFTDTTTNRPSGFLEDYKVGVNRLDRHIVIGFNKLSAHYVGFVEVSGTSNVIESPNVVCMDTSTNEFATPVETHTVMPMVIEDVNNDGASCISNFVLHESVADILSSQRQCQNCLRVATSSLHLDVKEFSCKFTKRKLSILTKSVGVCFYLCCDCSIYLEVNCKYVGKSLWVYGWPSAIACLLTRPLHSSIRSAIWTMLPSIHRESWSKLAIIAKFDMSVKSEFIDFGQSSLRYDSMTKSGSIADFIKAMDETCFPCVKCPAGCFAFVEECDSLTFNHFLAWKFGLSVFDSDRQLLNGARTDWPMSSLQLGKFAVTPGMSVTKQGLCILLCKFHGGNLRQPIVHIPRHPVLGDLGFQLPDIDAAAILTPNVIRAGRMGKWTNSSHVINAVGGYGGISSSSIAQRVDINSMDERLGAATFLAVEHRDDVRLTVYNRYLELPDGQNDFERDMNTYQRYLKTEYERNRTEECLLGGTAVLAADAFGMQSSFFNRDTLSGNSSNRREKNSLSLLFVTVHPPTAHGRHPYDISSVISKNGAVVLHALLRLFMHCSPLHRIMLNTFDLNCNVYLGKLLGFVKKLVCKSFRLGAGKSFRSAKEAQEATVAEMDCRKVETKRAHSYVVAHFLCSLSPDKIVCYELPDCTNVNSIMIDCSSDIVIIYRMNSRLSTSVLPVQLGERKLVAAFGDDNDLCQFYFRWNFTNKFWHVTRKDHNQLAVMTEAGGIHESGLLFPSWQLLVYAIASDIHCINNSLVNSLGGQDKMICSIHHQYLVKKSVHCTALCCVRNCKRNARWLCLAKGQPCSSGVCLSHGRDFLHCDVVVEIEENIAGRQLASGTRVSRSATVPEPESSSEDSFSSGSDGEIIAPIGQEDFIGDWALPSLHSRKDVIPIYDVNRRIPGHFIWNKGYGVLRRRMNVHPKVEVNAMMQHIVSVTESPCVSLLYPEGQLFPRTFWTSRDSAIVGALPSFMLNCFSNSAHHGVASLNQHHAIRIMDGDLLTSKQNSYWHYLFDITLNQQLTRYSSRLVFKRGLEFLLEDDKQCDGSSQSKLSETALPMDEAEATRRIKELASLLKKGKWTYFVTITINESETPGVREITRAIRQLADDDEKKERELTDAYLPFVLRTWERFVRVLFQELIMRNDNILGKVHHIFYRFEFQGAGSQGNKPHVHAGVTLAEESNETSLGRICCSSTEFASSIFGTDYSTLSGLGVVSDESEYKLWCDIFSYVNTHDCNRAGGRCMKATNAEGEKICRYHRQPQTPFGAPWFERLNVPYSEDVYILLEEMGLASREYDLNGDNETWVLGDSLIAGKWHYRAKIDEFFIASVPLLSAITRSATNVDMCDRHFQVSYLVKYIAGKEEHQLVDVAGSKNIEEVRVTTEAHAHEKIAGCKKLADKKALTHEHSGREVSLAEVVWFVLGFRYTYCTASFVHIPTLPLAFRAAVKKYSSSTNVDHITVVDKRVAAGLEAWRQFTVGQQAHIDEYGKSSLLLDITSAFNLRPPELLIFNNLQLYNECFVALRLPHSAINQNLAAVAWLDGIGRQVKLYSCSVDKCVQFLSKRAYEGSDIAKQLLREVFLPLDSGDTVLTKIFVKYVNVKEMVSVISLVKPWDRTKFLTHLCISLGQYETEMDVFCSGTILDAFVKVGLLCSSSVITRNDVLNILKKYITSDLAFHPISARQFSRYVKSAMDTLCDVFLYGAVGNYTPCLSEVMLKDQATDQLRQFEVTRRSNLISGLFDDQALVDPVESVSLQANIEQATVNTPFCWTPSITGAPGMSPESVKEQSDALSWCVRAVDYFVDPACRGVKFPCLVGRPGSGKSHVLKLACAYALSKGLQVELMSFTSERARKLGGNHMHLVFPLPVSRASLTLSSALVSECLKNLEKDPLKTAAIKRTDVFVYEEIGLLSSQMFGALDSILQSVMQNTLPYGGKLLMACGDAKQLPPCSGEPIWSSVLMCTLMDVIVFKSDVRARDPDLKWLNDQCRRDLDPVECAAVADRVVTKCRIAPDLNSIPADALRIVSTRAAENEVVDEFLKSKETRDFVANDQVQNNTDWVSATELVSRVLDKRFYEYRVCRLYVNAVVRMTYNERHQAVNFSQGQLAVVTCLPDESAPEAQQKLTLRLAPAGERHVDLMNIPCSWPEVRVGRRTTREIVVGRCLQMGRREQFPVRYHLSSTIHRIQGDTVALYATRISEGDRHYRLWQKEQFAVLISRAQQCNDIIFVGPVAETRHAIVNILSRTSKWDRLVDNYISSLDVLCRPPVREVRLHLHPFKPLYRELPTAVCGYVYLLVSISNSHKCFVGETDNLKKSLREHNTGYGAIQTRPTELHPWGVYAFVCGFELEDVNVGHSRRVDFLNSLIYDLLQGPDAVYNCIRDEVTNRMVRGESGLIIVKCGEMSE